MFLNLFFLLTSALLCDQFLVWQQDASPVGTDVVSGQSNQISVPSLHYQVLSSLHVQRFVRNLAPVLAPAHLRTGRGHRVISQILNAIKMEPNKWLLMVYIMKGWFPFTFFH